MRNFIFFTFLLVVSIESFSQAVVVRDPLWAAEDQLKFEKEVADRVEQFNILNENLKNNRENLKLVKDATEKLRKVNSILRNYKHMEEAIRMTANAYTYFGNFMKNLEKDNLFSVEEYRIIIQQASFILNSTSYSLDMIRVVLNDFKLQANDFERITLIDKYLEAINDDVNTLLRFTWELEQLNNHRMQIRTLNYMRYMFGGKPKNNNLNN